LKKWALICTQAASKFIRKLANPATFTAFSAQKMSVTLTRLLTSSESYPKPKLNSCLHKRLLE